MRIAAVDLGSNSFHLVVAEVRPDGTFEPLIREKEMLRLGDVVSREGVVTPEATEAAVQTVRRFRLLAEAAGATEILACATSALRSASNGDAVLDLIETEAGVSADVIDGLEEARLIFTAIRTAVLIDPGPALCFDLGGGSVEIMVGDTTGLHWAASERLGVARLSAEYVRSDPISKGDRRRLREHLVEILGPLAVDVMRFEPKLAIGSSGTLEDIANMVAARRDESVPRSLNQLSFSREEFEPLHHELVRSTSAQRKSIKGLDAKRNDLIVAGAEFLATAMELFEVDELTISEWALREGMVLDAIGRHDPVDWSDDPRAIRRASVQALARRFSWPEAHSRQVAQLSLELFDQTRELHGLERHRPRAARVRRTPARHRRARLPRRPRPPRGLPRRARPAARLRSRRDPRADRARPLAPARRAEGERRPRRRDRPGDTCERVRRLAALIRIADGLDRSRKQVVGGITARVSPSLVLLRLQTDGDPELELWGARRKRELFEKVFDRELELTAHPSA